jgi:serine/threonine protein kinase
LTLPPVGWHLSPEAPPPAQHSHMSEPQQRYRVIEKLESGGMAEVFRAESEGLQGFKKQVAIKRVLPHLSEKKKFISMFLDEARLSAHLTHSNCVQVFDIGVGDNAYFIVMEFVDGANLKSISESLRKQGKEFPVACAAFIALEICKGLSYAHELRDPQGQDLHIVHRDMSPPNVLITKYGEIKIVDFGLAKANSQLERSEPGIIKGKFSYLSPEAAMGQDVDARTDIFAVGIILWELLSGQRLFLGDTDFQTVKKVQQAQIPSISTINKAVPPDLERILAKSLARDPNTRYRTARELGQDLSKFMFKLGQAVSTFDIANLVQSAMRDRPKQKRKPQASIIEALIEEALLEFTSLTDEEKADAEEAKKQGSTLQRPSTGGGFVDPTNWADEFSVGDRPSQVGNFNLQAGNLSALEDEDDSSGDMSEDLLSDSEEAAPLELSQPLKAGPSSHPPPRTSSNPPSYRPILPLVAGESGGRKANNTKGIVLSVIAAGFAFVLAWYAHIIPH